MPIELKDIQDVANELKGEFNDFKKTNDKHVDAIKAENVRLTEKIAQHDEKMDELIELKEKLEKELKAANRPKLDEKSARQAEHQKAFDAFVRKGDNAGMSDIHHKMYVGLNTSDGYVVPETIDTEMISQLKDYSVMRELCHVMPASVGYKQLVKNGKTECGWAGATQSRGETKHATWEELCPNWVEQYAKPAITQTALDDNIFNIEQWLANDIAESFAEQEDEAFLYGRGGDSKEPKGLFSYERSAKHDTVRQHGQFQEHVEDALTGDALIDFEGLLRQAYKKKQKDVFMMSSQSFRQLRKLKDSNGQYLWRVGMENQPQKLLEKTYIQNDLMPAIGNKENLPCIIYGDFYRGYKILDLLGTQTLRDPYTEKPFVMFYTTKRLGTMVKDTAALKFLRVQSVQAAETVINAS